MKKILGLLLVSVGCTPSLTARWAPLDELKAPSRSDYPNADAVHLLSERQYLMVSRWRGGDSYTQLLRHEVIAVLSEEGFGVADVRVPYPNKAEFESFEARTIAPDGTVTEVDPSRIYDDDLVKSEEEGSNSKARVFSFPEVKVGSVLEYRYILKLPFLYTSIIEFPAGKYPVKKYRLRISSTKDTSPDMKSYHTKAPFHTEQDGDTWTIFWNLEDVPAEKREAYRRGSSYREPWVNFVVRRRAKFDYDFQYYTDWDHAVRFVGDDLYYDNEEYYAGFDPKVDYSGCEDTTCKVQRAVDYLTENYRFRGFGDWPGRSAKEATDAKAGSTFEKSRLLWWMLEKEGVKAKFAFANRYLTEPRDETFPSRRFGNHLILRVEKQEGVPEPLWVDPSCEYCRVGEVPVWLKEARALVVHARRKPPSLKTETTAEFVAITGPMNMAEGHERRYELAIDESGSASGALTFRMHGRSAMDERNRNHSRSEKDWKERAANVVENRHEAAELLSFDVLEEEEESDACRWGVSFSAPGYGTVDEGRILVPLTVLSSSWDDEFRKDEVRDLPIAFTRPENTTETLYISGPEGYEPINIPKERSASTNAVEVKVKASREGDRVKVVRSVRVKPGLYDKAGYDTIVGALDVFTSVRQDVVQFAQKPSRPVAETNGPK